jgi:3-isopropylmalate/(R)-2-methylmalate dehydratase large subunit
MRPQTIFDKIWNSHVIEKNSSGECLIYIDRHLVHEVTSPQAFDGLRKNNRKVRQPKLTLAVPDHNVPTTNRQLGIEDLESRIQVETLIKNCRDFDIPFFSIDDIRQGIVHIIGPEQGFTLPGTTLVCGDSHTSTHGAFGSLAFGIGTSEVEHVLSTQTLLTKPAKNYLVKFEGKVGNGISSKDIILHLIGKIGTAGGTGYVFEYSGKVIEDLSIEERMTICNMSIEAGARAGLINPDEKTFNYLKNKPLSPKDGNWDKAVEYWKNLNSDDGAFYDKTLIINASEIEPQVTWGTSPEDVVTINSKVPDPNTFTNHEKKKSVIRSLDYMGLTPGQLMSDILIDTVFIGSCTNGRIEDLRKAANILKNKKINNKIKAFVVPGSGLVKKQAEEEGLHRIFIDSGFEWREPGCSMCLAMNADKLSPKERCASTSNRNFEGRQGRGGRTHLLSPEMAAAAAIKGKLFDVRKI